MEKFLFFNIIVTAFNIFIIVYAYSLNFFPIKWRKKINQDNIAEINKRIFVINCEFLSPKNFPKKAQ